ncbi:DUF423 domain-containing protein [Thorsellia anophelis]|uniref:Uncharacterized membrane protein YgdD, TMEM256/DUF423 family n=1 Tax=Thorsellia anophelis DSM 18579 TaxID=1123402 RepID=A0A1I0AGK1_9GAMM|nr:DUF423 domain-containing protein [Thorsellia anophelis]SES93315.1 Uncharacterized membrane protein YgdD, TMEM256/DUF423 family [Thorsellia anophelis DSM 18579]
MKKTPFEIASSRSSEAKTLTELNGKNGSMLLFIALGGTFLAVGVILGAFGAHLIEGRVEPKMFGIWQTAVLYQLVHGLGLLFVGGFGVALGYRGQAISKQLILTGIMLSMGIIFFSGSLYILVLSGIKVLGAITPIGGMFFILGWLLMVLAVLRFYLNSRT